METGGAKVLFAADSNNLEPRLYDLLRPLISHLDALFIGMECAGAPLSWLYGPLLPATLDRGCDQSRRLNSADFTGAMRAIRSLGCEQVFVYAIGGGAVVALHHQHRPAKTPCRCATPAP